MNDILNKQIKKLYNKYDINNEYNLENHPLLITERYKTSILNRQKLVDIMFESFNIPSLYLVHSSLLSMYGAGTGGIIYYLMLINK